MFTPSGLFKGIRCPSGPECKLLNCVFSHEKWSPLESDNRFETRTESQHVESGNDRKRLKVDESSHVSLSGPKSSTTIKSQKPASRPFVGILASAVANKNAEDKSKTHGSGLDPTEKLQSMARPVSPPDMYKRTTDPTHKVLKSSSTSVGRPRNSSQKAMAVETLNPRLVLTHPVAHTTRLALLKKLHEAISSLNDLVSKSTDEKINGLRLSPRALVKYALDEEENIAKTNPKIYNNIMGHRIVAYKKMKLDGWIASRRESLPKDDATNRMEPGSVPVEIQTSLTEEQERILVRRFRVNLKGFNLEEHGYVLHVPSESDVAKIKQAVEAADFWEICDRCGTRFQVFPNRRADGALTSGGKCSFHWGKPVRQKHEKIDAIKGSKDALYVCCNSPKGSPGCTTHETHVFKASDPKRLAAVLQFEATPENAEADSGLVIAFDCEMGYTTLGIEVIRLSATTWPDGKKLIDVLVRPVGHVLDLNTRFSGVTPEQFLNAPELRLGEPASSLSIAPDPSAARSLLLSYISPETPLIGHAIENDLNVMRLIHPTIVDTALLFPHPGGLPYRFGLRKLVKDFLNRDVQTAGAAGHDSLEDSKATGDLVRWKIAREWKVMKADGWTITGDGLQPPDGSVAGDKWWEKKRKREV